MKLPEKIDFFYKDLRTYQISNQIEAAVMIKPFPNTKQLAVGDFLLCSYPQYYI